MMRKSYYLVLGVSPTESRGGIRRAFKDLVRRYHPDRAGPQHLGFFKQIVDAYHVLSDPERRRHYDQDFSHGETGAGMLLTPIFTDAGTAGTPLVPEIPMPMRVEINRARFDAALARIAALLSGSGIAPLEQCEGLDVQVILSPEQAATGGTGLIAVPGCSPCWKCSGCGREGLFPCDSCEGEGVIEEEETIRIHIPPGVGDGTLRELPLRGLGVHNFYLRLHIRVAYGADSERVR